MDNQNFYMRVLCLIIIVGAVVFYNSNTREKEYSQEITELTERVDSLESQQEELLTALQTWHEEQEKAAEEAAKAAEEAAAAAEAAKAAEEAAAAEESSASNTAEQDAAAGESAGTESTTADAEAQDDAAQTESSGADNVYQDGTFTGEGDGYGGKIQVQITIEDDTLTDVQVLNASGEDVAYLSLGKTVIDSVLAAQSTNVDTVTGATFSSTGILIAIEDALGKAENG